jgi:hypothetical protein
MKNNGKMIIELEEKDGVYKEKEEEQEIINISPDRVTFVFGFIYDNKEYYANTIVENMDDLIKCVDFIRDTLITTLQGINLIQPVDSTVSADLVN